MFSRHFLMDTILIETQENLEVDCVKLQKMALLYNAIQSGWKVKMTNDKYIFTKKHEGKKEIYLENYLKNFIESNMNVNKLT